MPSIVPPPTPDQVENRAAELLDRISSVLHEIYEPAGALIFWSARIKYLDDRRPCDLWRDRDLDGLDTLWRRLEALADGAFL